MTRILVLILIYVLFVTGCISRSGGNYPAGGGASNNIVVCPMCNGTGIFEFMPGDIMAPRYQCSGCNGSGRVDANTASQILKSKADVDRMFNGGSQGSHGNRNSSRSDERECWNCYGSGKCTMCAGRGERRYEGNYGMPGGIMDCSTCNGTGRCNVCHGRGTLRY